MKLRKKLIEVALPLEAINKACVAEGSPFTPRHPRSLHVWWARRRLAAARAVIFSQMVDDPSEYVDTLRSDPKLRKKAERVLKDRHEVWVTATEVKRKADEAKVDSPDPGPEPTLDDVIAEQERDRLFKIIEELVLWENTTNEAVLDKARAEIWQSWRRTCADNADHPRAKELFDRDKLPAFHDPFAGGGALPLEAQRLGLEAYASDLNPVAVLINKAMIEIPPKFAGMPPVNPEWQSKSEAEKAIHGPWKGAAGLAEDVRYYAKWIRNAAEKKIGHLYPKVIITEEMVKKRPDLMPYLNEELTVSAWIWVRTVKSPNPAFSDVHVPLAPTFSLSTKPGKEVFVRPIIEGNSYRFEVEIGKPSTHELVKNGTKLGRASFFCLVSNSPISADYIKVEGMAGRIGSRLQAVVAETGRGRVYISPIDYLEDVANQGNPEWFPIGSVPARLSGGTCYGYGLTEWGKLFSKRQLLTLTTFSDLVQKASKIIADDAVNLPFFSDPRTLADGGEGFRGYSEALAVYFGLAISRWTDLFSALSAWNSTNQNIKNVFSRHAIPMTWDYAESNPFGGGASFGATIETYFKLFESLPATPRGRAIQLDAATQTESTCKDISTDPPYYDNVCYADISDFFYVWLRKSMRDIFPSLFSTLSVPKDEELVAAAFRHGGKDAAEKFFLAGMTAALKQIASQAHPHFPVTIFYAFKQSESDSDMITASTGWETFLHAVIDSGFEITGTWPVRTERTDALKKSVNALASSIILVCRTRQKSPLATTRREFVNSLNAELPKALIHLQRGNTAPVDLAQAAIGPGMAVYTRYAKVLDAEGKPLSVRDALALINQTLDEVLAEQEGDFDPDTRFALTWFEQFGYATDKSGVAEVLATAKATSVQGVADAGIAETGGGNFRLLRPDELPENWTPEDDDRLTVWDMVHHLIRVLEKDGESAAARIAAQLGAKAETARELCYRLYTLCERKKRAPEALSYNALVQSWPEIMRLAQQKTTAPKTKQGEMFD